MNSVQIKERINLLAKLETLLDLSNQKKHISIPFISSKMQITPEECVKLLQHLYKFSVDQLTLDLNKNIVSEDKKSSKEEVKAVIQIVKDYGEIEDLRKDLQVELTKALVIFLYAIRVELQTMRRELLVVSSNEENMEKRKYFEELEKKEQLLRRKQEELQKKEETERSKKLLVKMKNERIAAKRALENILNANADIIPKFLEVASRRVSLLDEYGYENYDALYKEIAEVIKILLLKSGKYKIYEIKNYFSAYLATFSSDCFPYPYDLLPDYLEKLFKAKYVRQKSLNFSEIDKLNGVEFEGYIMNLLKINGIDDVRGTPTTGDQGADIIFHINDKTIAIQVKHHVKPIGNKAIQEVVGALKYYNADIGWVITSGTYTKSARNLAQKNQIVLIDRSNLNNLTSLLSGKQNL